MLKTYTHLQKVSDTAVFIELRFIHMDFRTVGIEVPLRYDEASVQTELNADQQLQHVADNDDPVYRRTLQQQNEQEVAKVSNARRCQLRVKLDQ